MRWLGFFGILFFVTTSLADIEIGHGFRYQPESGKVLDEKNISVAGLILDKALRAKDVKVKEEIVGNGKKLLLIHASYNFYLFQKTSESVGWLPVKTAANEYAKTDRQDVLRLQIAYSEKFGVYVMTSFEGGTSRGRSSFYFLENDFLNEADSNRVFEAIREWLGHDLQSAALEPYLKQKVGDLALSELTTKVMVESKPVDGKDFARTRASALSAAPNPSAEAPADSSRPELPSIPIMNERGERTDGWTLVESFTSDYLEEVKNDSYEQVEELRQIENKILKNFLKVEGGSVKLLAPAGVGKSVLMRRIAYRIGVGDVPDALKKFRVRYFSAASLEAGSKFVGTIEARINSMVEVSKKIPVLWFVDEAHAIAGAGITEGRNTNSLQSLKPALASGVLKWLAASTPTEWAAAFAGDEAMDRRFVRVDLTVPDKELLLKILNKWTIKYNKAPLAEALLEKVIFYSNEFGVEGSQPSKATLLLNEIYANADFKNQTTPITLENVKDAVHELYNVDASEMESEKLKKRLERLHVRLQGVIGQDMAKNAILSQTVQIMAGMHDRTKPRYRMMFSGDKGLGKTEMIKLFAQAMNLPEGRIVMSEFASPHQIEELKSRIAQLVRIHPMTVLSFDEFEKAHPRVQQALLGILESESFTYTIRENGVIRSAIVQIKNTSMFLLTNAGASYLASLLYSVPAPQKFGFLLPTGQAEQEKSYRPGFSQGEFHRAIVNDGVNPYVLDRLEAVIPFVYFSPKEFLQIVYLHTKKIVDGINKNSEAKFVFQNIKQFAADFTKNAYHPQASAREVIRTLNQFVRQNIAVLSLDRQPGETLKLAWHEGQIVMIEETPEIDSEASRPQSLSCKELF